jgi:hypothetical protein
VDYSTNHRKRVRVTATDRDGQDHGAVLEIYASTGKSLLWTLTLPAVIVLFEVLPALLGPPPAGAPHGLLTTPHMDKVVQILGVPVFGVLAIRILTILFSRAPRVVVSREGIWVNSLVFGSAVIPWTAIAALHVRVPRALSVVTTLHIVLRDRQTLRDRLTRFQTLLWWLGGFALVWPQSITVSDGFLPISNVELVGRIHASFQHELVQYGIHVRGA